MTKGFEIKARQNETHLFITNKIGAIAFTMGTFKGNPVDASQLNDALTITFEKGMFCQLTDKMAQVSLQILDDDEKKGKTILSFDDGEKKTKSRGKKK